MKFQILNNEELGFFDNNGVKKAIMKLSGSNFILDPVDTGANIIMGQGETVNDLELGIASTPVNMSFLGGGTITSNGGTLFIGDSSNSDSVILTGVTIGSSVNFSAGLTGSFQGTHTGIFIGNGSQLTGVTATTAPGGDNKNIQFNDNNTDTSGSDNFTFDKTVNIVELTGSINVSGSSSADFFFGDGSGLTNIVGAFPFTGSAGVSGSIEVVGPITASDIAGNGSLNSPFTGSANISGSFDLIGVATATSFSGNGSGLTGITSTFAPTGQDKSIQFNKNGSEVSGSAFLLFDYDNSSLYVKEAISASIFTGSFVGDGSQITNGAWGGTFTGSADISGSLNVNGPISASILSVGDEYPLKIKGEAHANGNVRVLIGDAADTAVTTARLIGIGQIANPNSYDRVAIGPRSVGGGISSVAIGDSAASNNTSGQIIAIGSATNRFCAGSGAIAIGNSAMYNDGALGNAYSIAIGLQAGYGINGPNNILIGYQNGHSITGEYNTSLGYQTGYYASGSKNVLIGHQAGYHFTGSNHLIVSNNSSSALIQGDFDNDTLYVSGTLIAKEISGSTTDIFQVQSHNGSTLFEVRPGFVQFGNLGDSLGVDFSGGNRYLKFFNTSISAQGGTGISATGTINFSPGNGYLQINNRFHFRTADLLTNATNAVELNFTRAVNHLTSHAIIRGDDNQYQPVPIYIFGGKHTTNGTYKPVVLQHDIESGSRGNVGIGLEDPQERLHVSGTVRADAFDGDGSKLRNIFLPAYETSTINKDIYYPSNVILAGIDSSAEGVLIEYRLTKFGSGSRTGLFVYSHDETTIQYEDTIYATSSFGNQPQLSATLSGSVVNLNVISGSGFNFSGFVKKFNKLNNAVPTTNTNTPYLLNEYTSGSKVVAYSIRQLNENYTGPCMRVRRSYDNKEINIGFTVNGDLDTGSIIDHCILESTGFTTTWYDQSGNGNDAIQTTASLQPIIYDGTSIHTSENNLPSLDLRTSPSKKLIGPSGIDYTSGVTAHLVLSNAGYGGIRPRVTDGTYSQWWFRHGHEGIGMGFHVQTNTNYSVAAIYPGNRNDSNLVIQSGLYDSSSGGVYAYKRHRGLYGDPTTYPEDYAENSGASMNPTTGSHLEISYSDMQEFVIMNSYESESVDGIRDHMNDYFNAYDTGLVTDYLDAEFAFSVRRLDSSKTNCIDIRRLSDNAEQTIEFTDDGDLNTDAIETFCNGTTCVVVKWYDQSGNDKHATQTNSIFQPTIYYSGSLVRLNGRPAFLNETYNYNDKLNFTSASIAESSSYTISYVWDVSSQAGNYAPFTGPGGSAVGNRVNASVAYNPNFTSVGGLYTRRPNIGDHTLHYRKDGADSYIHGAYHNGAFQSEGTNNEMGTLRISSISHPSKSPTYWQEGILWGSLISGSDAIDVWDDVNGYFKEYRTGLLAEYYNPATIAYSIRQLDSTKDNCMDIRRISDNTEQTIGFTSNGDLNTSSIETFCSGTECYVAKWYDQSGNDNHAVQSTQASQPLIYSASAVMTENGKAALAGGAMDYSTSVTVPSLSYHFFTVLKKDSNVAFSIWLGNNASNKFELSFSRYGSLNYQGSFTGAQNIAPNDTFTPNTQSIVSVYNISGSKTDVYSNGVDIADATEYPQDYLPTTMARVFNAAYGGNIPTTETIQEIIYYNSEQSNNVVGISNNINSYYNTY